MPVDDGLSMNGVEHGLCEAQTQRPAVAPVRGTPELLRRRLRLARAERLLTAGELASAFAHVLNQPLTAIIGYSDAGLLLERAGPISQDKAQRYFDEIRKQAHRAARGIVELRGLLTREAKQEPVDLNGVVAEIGELVQVEALPDGVDIALDLAADLRSVTANRMHIEQVLLALIENAVEAIRDTGARDGTIVVRTFDNGEDMAQISVGDNGPGLDDDALGRFGETMRTTKRDGLGVGLMVARSLIESHCGRLWAEPGRKRGAQVHVALPLAVAT